MSILTPFFNLIKPAKNDPAAIEQINANMDTIDTEMHRPPLTVNEVEPDANRDIKITTVPLADNLTSDEAQINSGTYLLRTSGGEASIADGSAWLSDIRGEMTKTGYVAESINMTVNGDDISAELDRDTFVAYVESSGTITLSYTTEWSASPALYGITVTGTPANGDSIVVVYVKENRGTISTASPSTFISTGWNLYNHAVGYARVVNYSEEYGFMIEGTYTALTFAETLNGQQTAIVPVDGYFTIPAASGYVFVTGGNATDTMIWMTWSDWIDEANSGVFQAYTQSVIDLSGVMVNFPDGLMRVGNFYDEINLNTQAAYSRIEKLEYTDENLEAVIASGVPYDTDTNYIYAVRASAATYSISLSGEYTVSDHGMEMFTGSTVPVYASSLYGQDLKGKLRRDVLTMSQQALTSGQIVQVFSNLKNMTPVSDLDTLFSIASVCYPLVNAYLDTAQNRPTNNSGIVFTYIAENSGFGEQIAINLWGKIYSRTRNGSGVIGSWEPIVPPTETIYLQKPTNSKWTAGTISVRKNGGVIQIKIDGATLSEISSRATLCNIPSGYRPATESYFLSSDGIRKFLVKGDGDLVAEPQSAGQVWGSCVYIVG